MNTPDYAPSDDVDPSRPSIGFPLGTALLLIVLFSLSGVFSCCYHWDKIKSLRGRSLDPTADIEEGTPSKSKESDTNLKQRYKGESVTVLMPGDMVPKFIALPCPCEPPRQPEIVVHVDKPVKPQKAPFLAIPLYI